MMKLSTGLMATVAMLPLAIAGAPANAQASSASGGAPTAPSSPAQQGVPGDAPASPAASTGASTTTAPVAAEPVQFGDIIVTAQKRSESINRVGLTIQAVSGDQLSQQGIKNVADLVRIVPSLSVANSTYNTPVYTLRGVGFYDNSLAAYPAVSVYVDEVPLPFPVLTGQAGLDVERVEVLKGPQGTLFGQNATGGAINYVAAKPTDTLKAGSDVSYSRFGLLEAQAFVSGPIGDTLRARVAIRSVTGGEWQRSNTRDDELGKTELFAGRLLLNWDPTSRLRFELNLNGSIDRSDPQASQYFALNPQLPVVPAALTNAALSPRNPRAADWNPNRRPQGRDRQLQAALRATYDVTDDITVTSITSYVDFNRRQTNDPDGLAADSLEFEFDGGVHSFDQELRIANGGSNRFRWILGGNYESNKSREFAQQFAGTSTVAATLGFPAHTNDLFLNTQTKTYAAFANGDFDITDQLTIKGGLRYTKAKRDAQSCTLDPGDSNGYVSAFFAGIASAVRGSMVTPPPSGGCITLNSQTFLPGVFSDTLDEDNVSWRAGIDYKPRPGVLLYANVAKGYKAGGYLFTNASNSSQYEPVTQESVTDYEAGFKLSLLNRRMQLNGAAFYYQYRDKQVRSRLIDPVFGVLDALVNVPKSHTAGAEVEINYSPVDDLTFNLAGTYVYSRVDNFVGVGFNGGVFDFDGTRLPFVPKWVFNAGANYKFALNDHYDAFLGGNVVYNDEQFSIIGADANSRLKPYALLDLRAGVATEDGKYRLTVYGKNVTNTYYYTNAPTIYDTQVRYAGRPATYGVSLSARY